MYWNIPVPKVLNRAVEEAIRMDMHATKSDFVRDSVRRRLEQMGFRSTPFIESRSDTSDT
jgi:Arc/MetJ-type ribon-helix-helix transcriptional regulator